MVTNKHTKTLVANHIHDGLLRDHCNRERWLCVPQDIDAAIARRERQIEVLKAMKVEIEGEVDEKLLENVVEPCSVSPNATICWKCGGQGTIQKYFDAGDHFGAGSSPFSGMEDVPCDVCDGKGCDK